MKKLKLFVVTPDNSKDSIYKNLVIYLKKQGIKVKKNGKSEK
jgi:hypothetical protein